ncbi:GGDEF domain-containing protein [Vogesella sp. DC21W]|uniref:diguanylate cyclase n=1 Tax=Vogesella aquatica TaxID=2984206 RepID=A0ABT5J3K3_9NEIS|nr:GGDEF domain-containing protein [Vogesella aquatica]MDC7718474.1 GGDEF domain-containing protein [Vogesella aquatica]
MHPNQWLLLIVQFYLYGTGWLLAILLIRKLRRLMWHYSLSSLCLASSLLLCMLMPAGLLSKPLPYALMSWLLLAGFACVANGNLLFMRLPAFTHQTLLLGSLAATLPLLLLGWLGLKDWRLIVISLEVAVLILWSTWLTHSATLHEFPGPGTWLFQLTSTLFGLLFLGRAMLRLWLGENVIPELYQPGGNNLLQAVAFMVMSAIFNLTATVRIAARMARQLHKLSQHDPLTSLLNRRALHAPLTETQLQRFPRYSIIMIDIDHFKAINDDYGHNIGDAVLAKFGRILRLYHSEHCQAFRLGGEEFALVLQDTPLETALLQAEQLRHHIAHSPLVRDGYRISFTASLGVAEGCASMQKLEHVLNAADQAMYTAKQQGRNCVCHTPRSASYVSSALLRQNP